MASLKNRANCSVFIFCFLLLQIFINAPSLVLCQSPVFACDVSKNPGLKNFSFCDTSLKISERVDDLVKRLTLQEKITFIVSKAGSVSRLGIPSYEWWSEALHGVSYFGPGTRFSNVVPGATSFPQPILTAASFNVSLFYAIGQVVSNEARAMYNVGLAGLTFWSPNINIYRDPRWGRGQETPGEDPLLSSRYGSAYVKGLQGDSSDRLKVAACCKHYTAYDVDNWKGVNRFTFDAKVTKQDMDDTYLPPFKSCVIDGKVASIMCSYNKVNGKPTCADTDLLSGVIRGQWNLNGYIVSDCDSVDVLYKNQHYTRTPEEAAAVSIAAGLDLDCGTFLGEHTEAAVKASLLNESAIDNAISNNFATLFRLGFFDGDPIQQMYGKLGPLDVCTPANQELARESARQGIVLLKNDPASLPFSAAFIKSLAVIGPNAKATKTMIGNYEGTPCRYTTPLDGLTALVPTVYSAGCPTIACGTAQLENAKKIAAQTDATILIVGTDQSIEAESKDRLDLHLPGQQPLLVSEVAKASKGPVILVIMSGGSMDITFAKDDPKISSILWVGFPGEAGGAAIADVIFGFYNPSGRLPMTWYPQAYAENVQMTNMNMRPDPATGYPGRSYRFYTGDTVYSFGDAPRQISIALQENHICKSVECKSIDTLSEKLSMSGTHTVLMFSTPPAVHSSPTKKLLGFQKVHLLSQMSEIVKFQIDICKDLSVVDELGNTKLGLGEHVLHIGDLKHILNVVA
ncbi:hypothetical protein MKX03_009403 [Papaver bracteatum]|nr:hypothetical protein MKX03_009403 [Papaver bracteatum]